MKLKFPLLGCAGPLFVSEDYEAAVKNLGANTTALLLNDLDTAAVMNYTDQRMEKEKLRGQMATFDMIDCYNQVRTTSKWLS